MRNLLKLSALALFIAVGAFAFTALRPGTATAQDEPAPESEAQQSNEEQPAETNVYSYTAQKGDSYTKIARKAVQTYGIVHNINLTEAAIIFAETNLTQAAGSPSLEIGEKVDIKEADLQAITEKAKDLSEAEQKAWSHYVQYVNFDTSAVGQALS